MDYRDRHSNRREVISAAAALAAHRHGPDASYETTANEIRADWGQAAIMTGCPDYATGGNGIRTDIKDALGNVAHFCARAGIDPDEIFDAALIEYSADNGEAAPTARDAESFPEDDDQ